MAANLSDLAAMGARPVLCTIALGVPRDELHEGVLEMYAAGARLAREYNLTIVGGDVARSPVLMLCITVVGEVRPTRMKRRAGAKPGDLIATTGALGASRAGLDVSQGRVHLRDGLQDVALRAHCFPQPRLAMGAWLAASQSVHAMTDLSDGLSTDVLHMARSSGRRAILERVPVSSSALAAASAQGMDATEYVLAAGEDYELLVAIAPRAFRYLNSRFTKRFGSGLECVGRFEAGEGGAIVGSSGEVPLKASGWDHLRRGDSAGS